MSVAYTRTDGVGIAVIRHGACVELQRARVSFRRSCHYVRVQVKRAIKIAVCTHLELETFKHHLLLLDGVGTVHDATILSVRSGESLTGPIPKCVLFVHIPGGHSNQVAQLRPVHDGQRRRKRRRNRLANLLGYSGLRKMSSPTPRTLYQAVSSLVNAYRSIRFVPESRRGRSTSA